MTDTPVTPAPPPPRADPLPEDPREREAFVIGALNDLVTEVEMLFRASSAVIDRIGTIVPELRNFDARSVAARDRISYTADRLHALAERMTEQLGH